MPRPALSTVLKGWLAGPSSDRAGTLPALAWLSWKESQPKGIPRLVPALRAFTVLGESVIIVKVISNNCKNYNHDKNYQG